MGIETARRELTLIVALGAEHIYLAVGRIVGRGHVDSAIIGVDANAVNGSRGNFGGSFTDSLLGRSESSC